MDGIGVGTRSELVRGRSMGGVARQRENERPEVPADLEKVSQVTVGATGQKTERHRDREAEMHRKTERGRCSWYRRK